jgi:uncharacterized protein (DUF983 family)
MGRLNMDDETKKKISKKNKEWALAKTCPKCGRGNALQWYPGDQVDCRYCKTAFAITEK